MGAIVILLIIAALVFGAIGLLVKAAAWALIIGIVLLIVGAVMGFAGRGRGRAAV